MNEFRGALGALAESHPEYSPLIDDLLAPGRTHEAFDRMAKLLQRVMADHLATHGPPPDDFESGVQVGYELAAAVVEAAAGAFARKWAEEARVRVWPVPTVPDVND